MKKLLIVGSLFIVLFSFTTLSTSYSAEIEGVEGIIGLEGNSYLTFIIPDFSETLIFSFEEDGTFSIALPGEELAGAGTYTKLFGVLFHAEWEGETTTYTLIGISPAFLIIGMGERTVISENGTITDNIRFFGINTEFTPEE